MILPSFTGLRLRFPALVCGDTSRGSPAWLMWGQWGEVGVTSQGSLRADSCPCPAGHTTPSEAAWPGLLDWRMEWADGKRGHWRVRD